MPKHSVGDKLGDKPIEPKFLITMNEIAKNLDFAFNGDKTGPDREIGFILMMFEFGESGKRCNYISNADRASVCELLREQLKKFEEDPKCRENRSV